jgi:hypothetical protein
MASLETVLTSRLTADSLRWFQRALEEVRTQGDSNEVFTTIWSGAGRRLGQGRIALATDDERCLPSFPEGWCADELGRTLLLQGALASRRPDVHVALVEELFATSDLRERQAVVRALPHLPAPERFVAVGIEAVRNNAVPVIEAMSCDNAFPARHFPDAPFNQMVLKCLFCEVPLGRVVDLKRRVTPELRSMVDSYAEERRAAGRIVPADVALILEP